LNWKELSSHQQRLITGFCLAIPLFGLIGFGPFWSWAILVSLVSVVALWEFEALMSAGESRLWERALYYFVGFCMPGATFLASAWGLHACLFLGLFLAFLGLLLTSPNDFPGLTRLAHTVFAWLYIPYLLSYVLLIGGVEEARAWVFFLLFVTMAGDAGAYYCGRTFGSRKLYERVSPKKTIEGSFGGFLCSMVVGALYGVFLIHGMSLAKILLLSAVLSLVGQFGDLFESMIKRMTGKKDSSQILPGHGGMLDRLDSLLFVFPVVWFFVS
jgi:phosphatidate cytidylyltransferase